MRLNRTSLFLLILLEWAFTTPLLGQISPESERFDTGKMWTFEYPPVEYFENTYDFDMEESWFEKARLGALRIPGCTASFVSSYGLVLTNHHCGRSHVTSVTASGEQLLDEGFYAESLSEERQVPDMYADQLISIEDVTDEVYAALDSAQTDAEKAQARQDVVQSIQARLTEASALDAEEVVVEVIPLYHGGRYSAYTFRRFRDVRLVMTPELQIGYFGGDTDNFTYPRYTLDVTFFRIYENGLPHEPDHFFLWSLEGASAGEPVFVIGNPGSTSRLETVSQLEVRRDMTEKNLLAFIISRIARLDEVYNISVSENEKLAIRNQLFSLRNARKAYTGQLQALNNTVLMARRQDAENEFISAIQRDAELRSSYGGVIDEMDAIQDELRTLRAPHGAFFALTHPSFSSAVLRRAMLMYQFIERSHAGAPSEQLEAIKNQIRAIEDQSIRLNTALLAARLHDIRAYFGEEDVLVRTLLEGRDPDQLAEEIVNDSRLTSQEETVQALNSESLSNADPAVLLVGQIMDAYREFQSAFAGLSARETEAASDIGRARFEIYGTEIPPDATFSLRIADGVVKGYSYNGTYASPFTSYFGMYDHYYSYGPNSEWALPERWLQPLESFDRSVPLNFASTNDITGGNSGSPVLNRDLELVGLIFDGNIESLSGNYIYLPEIHRSISVDARGILEALDEVYEADRLVIELSDDELVPSDEEAESRDGAIGVNR